MITPLTFEELRLANIARIPQYKDKHGLHVHDKVDGSDWIPAQWLQALVGEVGEYANLRKKHERGDVSSTVFLKEASKELADIMIYLDLLAYQFDIDLGEAVREKFNEVSDRVRSTIYL